MPKESASDNARTSSWKASRLIVWIGALAGVSFPISAYLLFGDLFTEFVWVDPLLMPAHEMMHELANSGANVRKALLGYAIAPLLYLPVAIAQYLTLKRQGNSLATGVLLMATISVVGMAVGIARWPVLWVIAHEFGQGTEPEALYPLFSTVDWLFGVVIEQFVGEFFWGLWMGATALALWGQRGIAGYFSWLSLIAFLAQIPGTFRSLYPEYGFLNTPNEYLLPLWAVLAGVWLIASTQNKTENQERAT